MKGGGEATNEILRCLTMRFPSACRIVELPRVDVATCQAPFDFLTCMAQIMDAYRPRVYIVNQLIKLTLKLRQIILHNFGHHQF